MGQPTTVSRQKTPASVCPAKFDISCVQTTRGMPAWTPNKDQLPFALDTESRALWIYTCENQWYNSADPLPPSVSATVAAGQVATGVQVAINGAHHPDCINGGELTVSWTLYDSLNVQIALGVVTIPEVGGNVVLPLPTLVGLSAPFRFETIATDYCGVSDATEVLFTTA